MTRPRAGLLINLHSRNGARAERLVVAALDRAGLATGWVARVRRARALRRATISLLEHPIDRLIVAGGDGTLGTVAPLLVRRGIALGVLPLGTANDFARTLGIPNRLEDAARVAAGDHARDVDLGLANGIPYLNVASVGMSVAALGSLTPLLKRRLGPAAYALAGIRAFLHHPTFRVRLATADAQFEGRAHQVVVANGRFYGGGVLAHHESTLDDGLLTAYTLGSRGRWELLRTIALLRFQVPLDRPGDSFLQTREVHVETWPPLPVNLDGEIRSRTPTTFSLEDRALRVFTPQDAGSIHEPSDRLVAADR